MRKFRKYVRSWRISRALARDPEWQRQVAESERAERDWVERGCPPEELVTADELRQRLGSGEMR